MPTTCPDRSVLLISQATAELLASYAFDLPILRRALAEDGWDL